MMIIKFKKITHSKTITNHSYVAPLPLHQCYGHAIAICKDFLHCYLETLALFIMSQKRMKFTEVANSKKSI